MRVMTISSILLTVLVIAVTVLVSLSGPRPDMPEPEPEEPPPFEELMPPGARADGDVALVVLLGEELVDMTMERFLIGAVAAEMPASFEREALKAQAVAARTDVLRKMYVEPKPRHPEAHVCGDYSCCMAFEADGRLREKWGAKYVENITKIIGAVIETDGVYLAYAGEPILAVFHSSSAGKTETSGNVWLVDMPYLISVDSPEGREVPDFVSTVTVLRENFIQTVQNSYPDVVFDGDEAGWITDVEHTESGRIAAVTLGGMTVRGPELRSMFGLRSTAVSIECVDGDFIFKTTGYGHGVGMSQYGANALALDGKNYRQILSAYYTGVEFVEPEEAPAL